MEAQPLVENSQEIVVRSNGKDLDTRLVIYIIGDEDTSLSQIQTPTSHRRHHDHHKIIRK